MNFLLVCLKKNYNSAAQYMINNIVENKYNKEIILTEQNRLELQKNIANILSNVIYSNRATGKDIYNINYYLNKNDLMISSFFCNVQIAFLVNEYMCDQLGQEESFFNIYSKKLLDI